MLSRLIGFIYIHSWNIRERSRISRTFKTSCDTHVIGWNIRERSRISRTFKTSCDTHVISTRWVKDRGQRVGGVKVKRSGGQGQKDKGQGQRVKVDRT
jgi:hypothetical protein